MRPSLQQIFEDRHQPAPGRTLLVGSNLHQTGKEDRRKRYQDCLGVDMLDGPGVDLVLDLEKPLPRRLGLFNHIECLSVLEHSRKPWLLAANLQRLLPSGGTLFVTVPFIWRVHNYPSDYWRFTADGLMALFDKIIWSEVVYSAKKMSPKSNLPKHTDEDGHPYIARTEILAFGTRA